MEDLGVKEPAATSEMRSERRAVLNMVFNQRDKMATMQYKAKLCPAEMIRIHQKSSIPMLLVIALVEPTSAVGESKPSFTFTQCR